MKIAVAGTGYVGLSMAVLLSQHNTVKAVDLVQEKVDMINAGKSPIIDKEIQEYLSTKKLDLEATTDGNSAYQETVMRIAKVLGYEVVERTIDRTELYTADEAFLCGSAMEITPIQSIDGYTLRGDEITRSIQKEYYRIVLGMNEAFRSWLTPIY